MDHDQIIKEQFTKLIKTSHAHASLDAALQGLPTEDRGVIPKGLPYSIWQLLDHLRISLWDIVEFCKSAEHISPKWPEGYWKESPEPGNDKEWDDCIEQIHTDTNNFLELWNDEKSDIYKPFPWGDGQTLLKEAIVIIDHNSYHIGQIVLIRRLLGDWK